MIDVDGSARSSARSSAGSPAGNKAEREARMEAETMRLLQGFDPFGRDPHLLLELRGVLDALLDRWFHLGIEGLEHLPASGRALLVCNHGGALPWDALVLVAALARGPVARVVRPLVEDAVMTAPFLGTFLTRLGCVRASQDNAERLLQRGEVCAVFPEGMRGLAKLYKQRNQLQRFGRGGFVRLALRTDTPLLPVAIVGSEDTAPLLLKIETFFRSNERWPYLPVTPLFPLLGPLGLVPLPARWRIRIGPPIAVKARVADPGDAIAINNVATEIRATVQQQVEELVQERGKKIWAFSKEAP